MSCTPDACTCGMTCFVCAEDNCGHTFREYHNLPEPTDEQRRRTVLALMDDMSDRERESIMQCYVDRFGMSCLEDVIEDLVEAYRVAAVPGVR